MNQDGDIDYRGYSREELVQALASIDRRNYPKNLQRLEAELAARPRPALEPAPWPTRPPPDPLEGSVYGGFWRRFGALWLDFAILLPLIGFTLWGSEHYRLFYLYYFAPGIVFGLFYSVYLVRRYGGTPGKLLLGLRIRKLDGTPVGYREALLRYLPEALLSAAGSVALILATTHMTDADYLSLGFMQRSERLVATAPPWYQAVSVALQIWTWSEFVVMMTNHRRRALHDFVAGTVVIVQASGRAAQAAAPASDQAVESRAMAPGPR